MANFLNNCAIERIILGDNNTYEIDHINKKLITCEYNDVKKKYRKYKLLYNGELYKDNIKIAENINNIGMVYFDTFICNDNEKKIMYYNGESFAELKFKDKLAHEFFDDYIILVFFISDSIMGKSYQTSYVRYSQLLNHLRLNGKKNYNSEYDGHTFGPYISWTSSSLYNTYSELNILKIFSHHKALDREITEKLYFYIHTPSEYTKYKIIHCDYFSSKYIYSIIDPNNIIDILFRTNQWVQISKDSTIEWFDDDVNSTDKLTIDGQIIEYNGKKIFDNEIILDVEKDVRYFTKYTKMQILTLLCIMKTRKIKMPKSIKFMIIMNLLKYDLQV